MSVRPPLLFAVVAAALLVGAFVANVTLRPGGAPPKFEAVDITGVDWGRDFELTDFTGKRRTLADFRGKVVLLFFGYTNCPDVCPTTMAKLGEGMRLLGAGPTSLPRAPARSSCSSRSWSATPAARPAFYPAF